MTALGKLEGSNPPQPNRKAPLFLGTIAPGASDLGFKSLNPTPTLVSIFPLTRGAPPSPVLQRGAAGGAEKTHPDSPALHPHAPPSPLPGPTAPARRAGGTSHKALRRLVSVGHAAAECCPILLAVACGVSSFRFTRD